MTSAPSSARKPAFAAWLLVLVILSLLPLAILQALRLAAGASFAPLEAIGQWLWIVAIAGLAAAARPLAYEAGWKTRWPWSAAILVVLAATTLLAAALSGVSAVAWAALGLVLALSLELDKALSHGRPWLACGIVHLFVAGLLGLGVVLAAQVESNFADEEFFVALQAAGLALFWLALRFTWSAATTRLPASRFLSQPRFIVDARLLAVLLLVGTGLGAWGGLRLYQASFYPSEAPTYPGISAANPFICGETKPASQRYEGATVFQHILALVEANPRRGAPEYGMLSLGSGEQRWAEAFRSSLLEEAHRLEYTRPVNSVKSVQFDAALRAYYYPRVRQAFPGLFTPQEDETLRAWFAAINRRALTVEWVDWMYSLALGAGPQGPYENQESGAGLLAALETGGLADPALSGANRRYLEENPRGWQQRFRNTDDAFLYQPDWITNAYFQSLYTRKLDKANLARSVEWMLLQALPGGAPLQYNHVAPAPIEGAAYLGASLTGDPRFLWAAGRAAEARQAAGGWLDAQPGVEQPVALTGQPPTQGSCLLYGDSGLPNQAGPLAPDKLVLRDGWNNDSAYLMLNLRFTGWHRYKATNSLTLFFAGGPLTGDNLAGKPFAWLPTGRSLFRDKRIPRENLNGLVIPRSGLSAVLFSLTGFGGAWAQDPPYYATVQRFETGKEIDRASVVMNGWRGWDHTRSLALYHLQPGGQIAAVLDDAQGPAASRAAILWHIRGQALVDGRYRLEGSDLRAEMLLLPLLPGQLSGSPEIVASGETGLKVQYLAPGRVRLLTIFLTGEWAGARVLATPQESGVLVQVQQGDRQAQFSLP